ncbi:hypothetical protein HWE04_02150 [Herbaspirillum sp. C7C2]|uniref:hypothetical protein n=1 Tax=Herbaspirillum sp. C7C2 TaxID=2736666 RepID=UPI001F51E8EA|nr:hypothetical protein [Herbaspirillum sp. C7C2]MCI1012637.1 hypothetical protein [Herbaspirillum sp. C7C2]
MTHTNYPSIKSLEDLATTARAEIHEETRFFNYVLRGELTRQAIEKLPLQDVTDKAYLWQQKNVPPDLIINHGSYIGDGVEGIASELQNKSTSNRALYSLINTKDISQSGDMPIPSFMVFQCGLEGGVLYCSAYFRALEVSNFLRINLEEMRLNLCTILKKIDATLVRITVFAFSAYNRPNQSTLDKPKLDQLKTVALLDLLDNDRGYVATLLKEKAREATFIEVEKLEIISEWASPSRKKRPELSNINSISAAAESAIKVAQQLADLRIRHSVHAQVSDAAKQYTSAIDKLAEEFRK